MEIDIINLQSNFDNKLICYDFVTDTDNHILDIFKLMTNNKIKINLSSYETALQNNHKNYYFLIYAKCTEFNNFKNIFKNKKIKKLFYKNNIKIFILQYHEICSKYDLKDFDNFLVQNKINTNNIYFFNSDLTIENVKKNIKINLNCFFTDVLLKERIYHHKRQNDIVLFKNFNKKKKLFLLYNRNKRQFRYVLLVLLEQKKLLNDINYSMIFPMGSLDYIFFSPILTKKRFHDLFPFLLKYEKNTYKSDSEQNDDIDKNDYLADRHTMLDYENSCISILTETQFCEKYIQLSEKTLKPFLFFQLPIFVAPQNHVFHIRNKYKFDFFDDIIDHSYDNEPDPYLRLTMIVNEIERLHKCRNEIFKIYPQLEKRLKKNRKICLDILKDQVDLQTINKILCENTYQLSEN